MQIYYNRPDALDAMKYTDFLEKYNTASKLPKYYEDNPNTENDVRNDRHYFKLHIDPIQAKRCICIEMLYVTSGDMFYLHLILLNKKAHSDKDVLTYNPIRGGGQPMVCTSYQQSAIAHGYVDSVTDVQSTFMYMCTNGTGAQCRSNFVVLSLNGYATHAIFDDNEKHHFMFMDYITYQGVRQDVAEQKMLQDLERLFRKSHSSLEKVGFPTPSGVPTELEEAICLDATCCSNKTRPAAG